MTKTPDNHLPGECRECQHEWNHALDLPMDMAKFVRLVRKIRCPSCGSKKINFNFGSLADTERKAS